MSSWLTLYQFDPSVEAEEFAHYSNPAWARLSAEWRERFKNSEHQLGYIPLAAYVISICIPFTMRYPKDHSPIVYIGEGMAHARFDEHLREKLLPMLATKLPAKFDFWVLPCTAKRTVQATEAAMLRSFEETYGAKPLFNTQSGKTVDDPPHRDWFVPLDQRRRGKRYWKIERV